MGIVVEQEDPSGAVGDETESLPPRPSAPHEVSTASLRCVAIISIVLLLLSAPLKRTDSLKGRFCRKSPYQQKDAAFYRALFEPLGGVGL